MAEPLKDVYNLQFLRCLGDKIKSVYTPFDAAGFVKKARGREWKGLALKARMRKIVTTLGDFLPGRYEDALGILLEIAEDCTGFPYLIFPDFVAFYGLDKKHRKLSLKALETFTRQSSAEFAIRPFIQQDPEGIMKQMSRWAKHKNEHVRRLASEGCRPRLPWGEGLALFKKNPAPVLAVLELLKADQSPYVRNSVANNLNDISKDNPRAVLETARRWKGRNNHTDWIIRHACRTLIRRGDPEALALFGYDLFEAEGDSPSFITEASLTLEPRKLRIGERGEIRYAFTIREGEPVHLRIEYGIDFVRPGGRTRGRSGGQVSRKLFLLSDKVIPGGSRISGKRMHRWADLTTRRHYPGEHTISLCVNGREIAAGTLHLLGE
jgi:3-methyladenine DNA glycosylase AlkC